MNCEDLKKLAKFTDISGYSVEFYSPLEHLPCDPSYHLRVNVAYMVLGENRIDQFSGAKADFIDGKFHIRNIERFHPHTPIVTQWIKKK